MTDLRDSHLLRPVPYAGAPAPSAISGPAVKPLSLEVTAARRRALVVLAERGYAHLSNETKNEPRRPRVYWQSGAWLEKCGLVRWVHGRAIGYVLELTAEGLELCEELAIPCR